MMGIQMRSGWHKNASFNPKIMANIEKKSSAAATGPNDYERTVSATVKKKKKMASYSHGGTALHALYYSYLYIAPFVYTFNAFHFPAKYHFRVPVVININISFPYQQ